MINHDAIRLLDWYFQQPSPFYGDNDVFFSFISTHRFIRSSFLPSATGPVPVAHTMDARFLADQLAFGNWDNYFAFATKVLNLLDEENFPLYDNHVGCVFQKPFAPVDGKDLDYPGKDMLDYQESVYQDILDTYRELENHPIIEVFRARFNCPDLGYMKILDAIFWRLGLLLDENFEQTPAEFLQEHGG